MINAYYVITLTLIQNCLICKQEFELHEGGCISYAFYVIYHVDYYYELVKLFNPNKEQYLYAMKIENKITNPKSEFNFNHVENNTVYFYLLENYNISLSYMFKDINKFIDFSFNNKYINNLTF